MHRSLALGFVALGAVLAGAYSLHSWPAYEAEAVVYLPPPSWAGSGFRAYGPSHYDPAGYDAYLEQQILTLMSPQVLGEAASGIHGWQRGGESEPDAVARLGQAIDVARVGHSYQISVRARAHAPQMAASMANAVTDAYLESRRSKQKAENARRETILRDERAGVNQELAEDILEQAELNGRSGTGVAAAEEQIARIHDQLVKANADHDRSETGLEAELREVTRDAVLKQRRAAQLAADISRQQARYSALDEQLQNLLVDDATQEGPQIAIRAVPPLHAAAASIIWNALTLLFGCSFLGLLVAVIAYWLDPRVYVASDVEAVLGLAPLAALPDFEEVSAGVAEEYLLRLSAALEHGYRVDHLKNWIFTGAGPQSGTTTLTKRVRGMLEGMGRPAVTVETPAASSAQCEAGWKEAETGCGTSSLAVIGRLTDDANARQENLVLADTAPLIVSAETEFLARNVDCVVVVMESGVTTRAQLRATAEALRRLDAGAVAFVLNRIGMDNADRAFRCSARGIADHLRKQERAFSRSVIASAREIEREPQPEVLLGGHRSATREPLARESAAEKVGHPQAEETTMISPPSDLAGGSPTPEEVFSAGQWRQLPVLQLPPLIGSVSSADSDLPWWFAEDPIPGSSQGEEKSRLSGLRNLMAARRQELHDETAASWPDSFRSSPEQARPRKETIEGAMNPSSKRSVEGVPAVFGPHSPLHRFPQDPGPAGAPPKVSRDDSALPLKGPDVLPPRRRRQVRIEEEFARRDRSDTWDDLAVLPSWRGQYRRRDKESKNSDLSSFD